MIGVKGPKVIFRHDFSKKMTKTLLIYHNKLSYGSDVCLTLEFFLSLDDVADLLNDVSYERDALCLAFWAAGR